MRKLLIVGQLLLLTLLLLPVRPATAQDSAAAATFKQEELDQMLAPIALYPDSLVSQILMASTYPMEVVQADRWAQANKTLKDPELTAALEKQPWDPSVKSLVAFPDVLKMMDEKLEVTQKIGDAFLAQQKDVMATIQSLRKKAQAAGNLKSTKEQTVVVEKETQIIVVQPADPKVVYVPAYNPVVVYGPWWYPSYPPYPYYPPAYVPGAAAFGFCAGVATSAAWGYAWGNCNWHGGDVDIDINHAQFNNVNINKSKYSNSIGNGTGQGSWNHNPEHRKGTPYKDSGTAQRYNKGTSRDAQSREAFRGQAESGRNDPARGGADKAHDGATGAGQGQAGRGDGGAGEKAGGGRSDAGAGKAGGGKTDAGAFGGMDSGKQATTQSSRGRQSMSSSRSGGAAGRGSAGRSSGGGRRR